MKQLDLFTCNDELLVNKHGVFKDTEAIEFSFSKSKAVVEVAFDSVGNYYYGIDWHIIDEGGGFAPSIGGIKCESRLDAIELAMNWVENRLYTITKQTGESVQKKNICRKIMQMISEYREKHGITT